VLHQKELLRERELVNRGFDRFERRRHSPALPAIA
jgi:hypothetical protein